MEKFDPISIRGYWLAFVSPVLLTSELTGQIRIRAPPSYRWGENQGPPTRSPVSLTRRYR